MESIFYMTYTMVDIKWVRLDFDKMVYQLPSDNNKSKDDYSSYDIIVADPPCEARHTRYRIYL